MASVTVGENQLQRIIRDLHDAVAELSREYVESGEPITDDSSSLHKFCYKLEYLLQYDQKEKATFLGSRKDYWDYFCECLAKVKGTNDGIRFVKCISELKTSLGRGRAFIRYCLVHQRLADTLQQCLMNQRVTCDWYYARSPFLKSNLNVDIINQLYELNEIQFDVVSRGYDLDSEWPTFARRTLGSATHMWRPPSRSTSVSSLISSCSQPTQEFLPYPDFGSSLLSDLGELGELSCKGVDDLRTELDQSELRQQNLLKQVHLLTGEATELRQEVGELQEKLLSTKNVSEKPQKEARQANGDWTGSLQPMTKEPVSLCMKETSERPLGDRLSITENKNMELLSKLDKTLNDKGQQAANYCDPASKKEELLGKLEEAEMKRQEALRESEGWAKQAKSLAQELTARDENLKESEERLAELQAALEKERTATLQQTNELQAAVNRLEDVLFLKEQEAGSLHIQLQDVQKAMEERENQMEEMKRREQEGHEELHQRNSQILALQEQLKLMETENSICARKIKQLENQSQRLSEHNQNMENQGKKLEEYQTQCSSLMEINNKLLHTIKRAEESNKELVQSKAALERELATLKASQKPLHARLDSAGPTAEERENKLLEDDPHSEESMQKAQIQREAGEIVKMLEKESEFLIAVKEKHEELDVSPCSMETETGSDRHLTAVQDKEQVDKSKDIYTTPHSDIRDGCSRLALAEAQLDLNMKEVSRLQGEVMDLRALLQVGADERIKIQALQEVTEASREDLRSQTEQLKAQVEELNRQHGEELRHCGEREEAVAKERDGEALARKVLQAQVTSIQEELDALKRQDSTAALEKALHGANTEIAELGNQVGRLTTQNQELVSQLQELEEQARKDMQALGDSAEALSKDNTRLLEELKRVEGLPKAMKELQQRLEEVQEEARSLRKYNQREMNTLRHQLGEQTVQHGDKMKVLNEELLAAQSRMETEKEKVATLETRLAELEAINKNSCQMIEEKNASNAVLERLLLQKEEQLDQTKGDLLKVREEFVLAQKACQDLSENLHRTTLEKESCELKTSAEIDDLYRTKRNLEERLVELIREKDALWQKSDALEFEQKLRAEEETERALPYCLGCNSQFGWWLRRHNCKLCGRPFCLACCSNTVSVHQGGSRERCCKDCFSQHSAIAERPPQEDLGGPSQSSPYPLASTPSRRSMLGVTAPQSPRLDDMAFDIITDEEVNDILDSDSLPYTTALSPGSGIQGPEELGSPSLSGSTNSMTPEDPEDLGASTQDAELCLVKSGEMTLSVPFTVEEIAEFGKEPRELFVKSGCYSRIPVTVCDAGSTIGWVFTSTPKSISFSVVYRQSTETPLEQTKVLIPLTRCNSHKQSIRGQLKARDPGEYCLVFDNSFSRFISKKVLYSLSVEQPAVYDGSDCL